jgi:hypothetical protein
MKKKLIIGIMMFSCAVLAQKIADRVMAVRIAVDGTSTYIGQAAQDKAPEDSDAVWQIALVTTNGIYYARTSTNVTDYASFNKVWTNRAEYVYDTGE